MALGPVPGTNYRKPGAGFDCLTTMCAKNLIAACPLRFNADACSSACHARPTDAAACCSGAMKPPRPAPALRKRSTSRTSARTSIRTPTTIATVPSPASARTTRRFLPGTPEVERPSPPLPNPPPADGGRGPDGGGNGRRRGTDPAGMGLLTRAAGPSVSGGWSVGSGGRSSLSGGRSSVSGGRTSVSRLVRHLAPLAGTGRRVCAPGEGGRFTARAVRTPSVMMGLAWTILPLRAGQSKRGVLRRTGRWRWGRRCWRCRAPGRSRWAAGSSD